METVEFHNVEEAETYLSEFFAERLTDDSFRTDTLMLLGKEMASLWVQPIETVRPPNSRPAHIAGLKWVIRNDDLKVLDSVLDGVKASAGAGFFVMAGVAVVPHVVAGIGIVAGFFKLGYNALTKGAVLSSLDYSILATIIDQPSGLTEHEILNRLSTVEPQWTIEAVAERLTALTEVPSRSGKITLVWKSSDNRWRTTGV